MREQQDHAGDHAAFRGSSVGLKVELLVLERRTIAWSVVAERIDTFTRRMDERLVGQKRDRGEEVGRGDRRLQAADSVAVSFDVDFLEVQRPAAEAGGEPIILAFHPVAALDSLAAEFAGLQEVWPSPVLWGDIFRVHHAGRLDGRRRSHVADRLPTQIVFFRLMH